jgi:rRNA-processing protein FCF1
MGYEFITWPADPAYLDIALERQAVLWTMDKSLKKVAEKLGVSVAP